MTYLNSYNNNPTIKTQLVAAMIADKEAENVVKGHYYFRGRGCNIGCAEFELCKITGDKFTDMRHSYLSKKLQIPEFLLQLADTIFERLPEEQSQKWAGAEFWEAIPVGKDLTLLDSKIKIEILINNKFGCYQYADAKTKVIINQVVKLHKANIEGEGWDAAAANCARFDAVKDDDSAVAQVAWYATSSAARSAGLAASYAADLATARHCFYLLLSEKVIELIKES